MKHFYTSMAFFFMAMSFGHAQISFNLVTGTTLTPVFDGAVAFADIDGDNDQDVLISGLSSGVRMTELFVNDGNGNYTLVAGTPFVGLQTSGIAFADIDGDNDQDVLITGFSATGASTKLYTNNGAGVFTEAANSGIGVSFNGGMAFADVDGDTDMDVVISGINGNTRLLKLYLNNGSGVFDLSPNGTLAGVYFGSLNFADVDGDGDQDFLVTGLDVTNTLVSRLYTNNGTGIFSLVTGTPFVGVYQSSSAFADIDGDNDIDVLITGNIDGSGGYASKIYTNNGSGTFSEAASQPFPIASQSAVAFADVDNDGDQDVFISGFTVANARISKLYKNNGNGQFSEVAGTPFVGVSNSALALADIDGDTDVDVLITGIVSTSEAFSAKLYKNESVLGTLEFSSDTQISFHPNPSTDIITFQNIMEKSHLEIYDITGKKVFSRVIDANDNQLKLDFLSEGIYILKINSVYAGKLVKSKR
ncbi:MAG: FG-GAP-like repeat-containing protein [Gelidibacter sp.]